MNRKIPTRRHFIKRAGGAVLDALNANPWLLPAGVGMVLLLVNYP